MRDKEANWCDKVFPWILRGGGAASKKTAIILSGGEGDRRREWGGGGNRLLTGYTNKCEGGGGCAVRTTD